MIKKLKRKFIIIATVCMLVLMAALLAIMNTVNYRGVVAESDAVLDVLAQPLAPLFDDLPPPDRDNARFSVPSGMSPEVPYESRFFVVTVSKDGEREQLYLSRIVSVDGDSAAEYIDRVLNGRRSRGFVGQFRYLKAENDNGTVMLFLDCGRKLGSFSSFLRISVIVGLAGCVVVFAAFVFAAGKILAPIAESYEKQKRFISDAGHEIRTPLTIINANVDLMELDGETEELTEIRQQTVRLTDLTNKLVLLSKMEEDAHDLQKVEIPLSDLVTETAGSFRAPAVSRNLELAIGVEPDITATASPDAVRQLISILLENAVKYTPEGGTITVGMERRKKNAVISVRNPVNDIIDEKTLPRVFDRFYRTDESRNSQTGGHGIGLSIAKAIVDAHGGEISASTTDGHDFRVTVSLPC